VAVVNGDKQLAEIGARLRAAGDVGITRVVRQTIRGAAKPLIPIIQESARESLPKAGGMNNYVARRRPRTQVKFGARTAAVRIVYKGKGAPSDNGPWRHPVFAKGTDRRAWKWVPQEYKPAEGWWERAEKRGTPPAELVMRTVLETVKRQVNGWGL
jgi:hypothetical protein